MDRARRTDLHYAAMADDVSRTVEFLKQGFDVNAQDEQGFTPLHFAAQEHSVNSARTLIEAGADVDAENVFGNTPLFVAIANSRGRGELIDLLRACGSDPTRENKSGQSPVGLARLIGNFDVAKYFSDVDDR